LPGKSTIRMHPERLGIPNSWRTSKMIFVNSMSDLFHEEVPLSFISKVFSEMEKAGHHTFQILTKRHLRLAELAKYLPWPSNVWMGVSVENQYWADRRVPVLKEVPAAVRFLSCEPLLKLLDLRPHLDGINWVIAGGESGSKARPMELGWVRRLRDDCQVAEVPFFFKQWGGRTPKAGGRSLDGRTHDEMPKIDDPVDRSQVVLPAGRI